MIYESVDATKFGYSNSFYILEFEDILRGVVVCSNHINLSGITLPNDENKIRNIIVKNFLKVESFKKAHFNLASYHFDYEVIENEGRTDIRILPIKTYINDEAYFIIECKRLDNKNLLGITGLNAEYVKNGICRFVTGYYSSYYGINGMIGFVVEDIDIDTNVININSLLGKDLTNDKNEQVNAYPIQEIEPIEIIEDFKYSYKSTHKAINQKEIDLYHLMLNFSNIIQ